MDRDGVEIRSSSLRLFFVWNGVRYRETLTVNGEPLKPTARNIAHARTQAAEIKKALGNRTFVLADFFPDSSHAGVKTANNFGDAADSWLASMGHIEVSTRDQYTNAVEMWKRVLGADRPLDYYTHAALKTKLGTHGWASARSFNNYMIVLRGIFALHMEARSPCIGIKNRKRIKKLPDPLKPEERDRILVDLKKHYDPRVWAYFQFAFFTGMRPEEIIALQWGDIDFETGIARVQRVRTFRGSERDGSKTNAERDVDLVSPAMEALATMKPYTFMKRDDIFESPNTGRSWHDERSQRETYWQPCLKRLGIRRRRPYACRHTYCTAALMRGVNPAYVASQAGHSLKMLLEDYFRWIPGTDGGEERAKLEAAAKVPQKFPEQQPTIGRRDWTRTNPRGSTE